MLEEIFEPVVKDKGQTSEKIQTTSFFFKSKIVSGSVHISGSSYTN